MSAEIPWAMICSVPEGEEREELLQKLRDFGVWLIDEIANMSNTFGMQYRFESQPRVVLPTVVDCLKSTENAYQRLHADHPQVIMVLHILSGAGNSKEHDWMRRLSQQYGLIRQGVNLENALNRFQNVGVPIEQVIGNILQWTSRRLSQLVGSKQAVDRMFELKVSVNSGRSVSAEGHDSKENHHSTAIIEGNCNSSKHRRPKISPGELEHHVTTVLHMGQPEEDNTAHDNALVCMGASVLAVSGYPSHFTAFQIAGLLTDFAVLSVSLRDHTSACVELATKYQAVQACERLNGTKLWNNKHTIAARMLDPELQKHVD